MFIIAFEGAHSGIIQLVFCAQTYPMVKSTRVNKFSVGDTTGSITH